jgi:hypothetical protein
MKEMKLILAALVMAFIVVPSVNLAKAQGSDSTVVEKPSLFSANVDLVTNYIWRGSKFGKGPAFQPGVKFSVAGLTLGAWGSYCFSDVEAAEADLYASYAFKFGLTAGLTDYYYPGTDYFSYSGDSGSHAFEANLAYSIKGIGVSANYIFNQTNKLDSTGTLIGAGSAGGDTYFEVNYTYKAFKVFVGAGDGWHTSDGDFMVCNIGVTATKALKISDKWELPVSASAILNPEKEQFYVVAAISF